MITAPQKELFQRRRVDEMWKEVLLMAPLSGLLYMIINYKNGCKYKTDIRLDGKVAIVTGANTGIGKETVKDLVSRGAKVFMACRSLARGRAALEEIQKKTAAKEGQLAVLQIDLSSLTSVRAFVKEFKKRSHRLDILINNAGVLCGSTSKTEDGFEVHLGVNHLGHFLLTHLLVDVLLASAPSRVVTVSSMAHTHARTDFDWVNEKSLGSMQMYAQSKLANLLFARELAKRLEGTGVTSYSLHPGFVATDLARYLPVFSWSVFKNIVWIVVSPFFKDAYHGARTQVYLAIEPNIEEHSGKYFSDCAVAEPVAKARDDKLAEKLWAISVELVGLQPQEIQPKLIR